MIRAAANAYDGTPHLGEREIVCEERALGFWLYLMSDSIVFALLFATFVIMQAHTAGGLDGRALFSLSRVFLETMTLLLSSFTYGLAFLSARASRTIPASAWLIATLLLGLLFIGLELDEFRALISAGNGPERNGPLSAFFSLVGTHGVHVSVGILGLATMIAQIWTKGATPNVLSRLYRLGMFWHFLDIVWIGIFSIVYLPAMI